MYVSEGEVDDTERKRRDIEIKRESKKEEFRERNKDRDKEKERAHKGG